MNRYEPSGFHPYFGVAALAMTAVTIALTVFVPVSLSPVGNETTTLARGPVTATEAAISPARIDVVGIRERARG